MGGVAQAAFGEPVVRSPLPLARPTGLGLRAIPDGDQIVDEAGLSGAVSYALADVATGAVLEMHDPLRQLPPASVAKAMTALYALETLGPEYRFSTRVLATGPVVEGVVQGDVILAGGGDPTLDTDMLAGLAKSVVDAGVHGVTGRFLVWDGELPRIQEIDATQTEYAGYNPTISGLNLNYNRVHFEWKRGSDGYSVKMDARAQAHAPDVRIARMVISDRAVPVFDHEPGESVDRWSVARGALGNGGARWLPVRLPALYAGEVFVALCGAQSLRLPRAERVSDLPEAKDLARHDSPPLTHMLRDMLKYSTNLTAEVIGIAASHARGGRITSLEASARRMNAWARVRLGMRHMSFVDHSGLGGASEVSVADMVKMLSAQGVEAQLAPILKPIPVYDLDGNALDPPVSVVAKTGTLDFVSTLAGYVTAPGGKRMAFAIFAGDEATRAAAKANGAEVPRGAKTYNTRAKRMQQALLRRWGAYYAL
ncbi:D-alanyl-D-alanine carboxypeptidase/D-alanyl-D-alanine-endopeptidase [Celeribacter arenosi]|uniref:D-alanyl-D-alanine carboxypeptidase/D-alanyl-D-alanine-endopeptidase n=1 Tax=Celeribacter arenosi TaxID=792649 RepID=A0ABP7K6L4_9RHOB